VGPRDWGWERQVGMRQERSLWLHRFALLTAFATFLLIIAGALVVGHDAGLSVPDWPLSYGKLMPRMTGNIFYEHGHRMIAGLVGALTIALAVWLWRAEGRPWVRWLGIAALFAVILQAVLGGITVLYLLPVPVLVGHACLAQLFFCITVSLAVFTDPAWDSVLPLEDDRFPAFRHVASASTAAIYVQLILGAARRHKALGLTPHLIWAGVVAVLVLWMVYFALNKLPQSQKTLRNLSWFASALLVLQLALGYGSYWTRLATQGAPQPDAAMIDVTTAHVAVGAMLLATSLVVTLLSYRRLPGSLKEWSFSRNTQKTLA
jgi:heme a synthase